MKTVSRILFATAVLFAANKSNAQATAQATATATIVTPIAISKNSGGDMNFGNIAVTSSGGTVTLAPNSTRSTTGGVTLPATTGSVAAASFNVTGNNGYTYAITLPSSALTLTHSGGSATMSAGTFTSSPSATGTLSGSGSQTLTVGATLTVSASQLAGVYTSGNFDVTVNYN